MTKLKRLLFIVIGIAIGSGFTVFAATNVSLSKDHALEYLNYNQDSLVIGNNVTTTPSKLEVNGQATAFNLRATSTSVASVLPYASSTSITTTATSSMGGITLTSGCFAIGASCLQLSGGSFFSGSSTPGLVAVFDSGHSVIGATSTILGLRYEATSSQLASTFPLASTTVISWTNASGTNATSSNLYIYSNLTVQGSGSSTIGGATFAGSSGGVSTSSATNGWNITNGCFAINGVCIGSGSSGGSFFSGSSTPGLIAMFDSNHSVIGATGTVPALTFDASSTVTASRFPLASTTAISGTSLQFSSSTIGNFTALNGTTSALQVAGQFYVSNTATSTLAGGLKATQPQFTALTAVACDVKSTTDGTLYCGTDVSGAGSGGGYTSATGTPGLVAVFATNNSLTGATSTILGLAFEATSTTLSSKLPYASSTSITTTATSTLADLLVTTSNGLVSATRLNVTGSGTSTKFTGALDVTQNINVAGTSASSTFATGISLTNGCYSIANNCLSLSNLSGSVTLTTQVTGILPIANGGTNSTAISTNNVVAFDGTRYVASSTPVASYLIATSTAIASRLPYASTTAITTSATSTLADLLVNQGNGLISANRLNWTGATSTGAFGINLTGGCYAMNGTCLSTGGSTNAAGGTGAVQFANGTSFAGGNAVFFWDNTKKMLGIGTATPQNALLTLSSSTQNQLLLNEGNNNAGYAFRVQGGNLYISTTSPSTYATSSPLNSFALTNNSSGARIGVNVGNPQATLHLYENNGTGASPSTLWSGNAGGDTDYWAARMTDNDGVNDDSFQFGRDTTPGTGPIMTLDYTKNVGIGTTSPYSKLSVTGQIVMESLFATSTISTSTIMGNFGVGTSSASWPVSFAARTVWGGAQFAGLFASTSANAQQNIDWNSGNSQRILLSANTTILINATSSNPVDGAKYTLKLCQDPTGSRTVTWDTGSFRSVRWWNGTTTITATANRCTYLGMIYDSTYQTYSVVASSTNIDLK